MITETDPARNTSPDAAASDSRSNARDNGTTAPASATEADVPTPTLPTGGQLGLLLTLLTVPARIAEGWQACCPACQDGPASLLLTPDAVGNVVIARCIKGCGLGAILASLGVTMPDS